MAAANSDACGWGIVTGADRDASAGIGFGPNQCGGLIQAVAQGAGLAGESLSARVAGAAAAIGYYFGLTTFILSWFYPFLLAFAMGSYLFYCQHNFPGAKFRDNHDWSYVNAAISSTSFMKMNPAMQWITGNIGYHHVHHINSRIPFYRLEEAMSSMPELKDAPTTSWHPLEIIRCFQIKLWDTEEQKMITLQQLRDSIKQMKPDQAVSVF